MFNKKLLTCNQPTNRYAGAPRALSHRIGVRRARPAKQFRPSASGSEFSPLTWDELASKLPSESGPKRVWDPVKDVSQCKPDGHPTTRSGTAVLYRDKNGWCPYSERVWLGLEFKGVEFDEVLINNQGSKPQFWYSMAGGTTPVVRWPSGKTQGESMDILMELDGVFPDSSGGGGGGGRGGRMLLPSDPQSRAQACQIANSLKAVLPRMCRPSSRAAFLYRGSGPVPRKEFEASLDTLEEMLAASGGPFFMGEAFTIADCAWVPFLERFAVQLPLLHQGLEPRDPERWPCLSRWYRALEEEIPAYPARVQGDALSWAAVLAVAGYGNAGSAAEYKAPGGLSFQLGTSGAGQQIWEAYASGAAWLGATPAEEAARILVSNHTEILSDCLKHSAGAIGDKSQADAALRFCSQLILSQGDATRRADAADNLSIIAELDDLPPSSLAAVQAAAEYLHTRICVPRDMGHLAADCYHAALSPLLQPPDNAGRS